MREKSNTRIASAFLCLLAAGFLVRSYVFSIRMVEGSSMNPTLHEGDIVFIDMWKKNYTPGDIVIFKPRGSKLTLIKRVMAGPNSVFFIEDYRSFVDKKILSTHLLQSRDDMVEREEVNLLGKTYLTNWKQGTINCRYSDVITSKVDEFILIGDNRCESGDSRMFGPIVKGDIKGIVVGSFSI